MRGSIDDAISSYNSCFSPVPQGVTQSTPTALQPTADRPCLARWRWNTTSSSSPGRSTCSTFMWLMMALRSASGSHHVCAPCRWFCHVDDDNYVNVRTLVKHLSQYPHTQDMYIGKPSLDRPIEATERLGDNKMVRRSLTLCIIIFQCEPSHVLTHSSAPFPFRNQSTSGLLPEEQASV